MFLPNINSAGDKPVVECGVHRYLVKNLETLSLTEPPLIFTIALLKV